MMKLMITIPVTILAFRGLIMKSFVSLIAMVALICGAYLVVKGAFLVNFAAGLIVLGIVLVIVSQILIILANTILGGDD